MTPPPTGEIEIDETRLDNPALLGENTDSRMSTVSPPAGFFRTADVMLRHLAASGAHVREASALTAEAGFEALRAEGRPRAVVVAGVGPAALTGEILTAVAGPHCPVPVLEHRNAGIPGWVGAADAVIAVSASGKSPEALAAAEAAMHRGARLVAISAADSPLHAMAERARGLFVPVPLRRPARINLWGLVVPVLLAGRALGLVHITETELAETANRLDADADRCRASAEAVTNEGKNLALELAGSIPLVWGSSRLAGVAASRFADQLAANARYPAITGALVEASRGRVGVLDGIFGGLGVREDDFFGDREQDAPPVRLRVVSLRESGMSEANLRRADAVEEIARERNVGVSVVVAEGASPLERLASLIMIPDFASVYLAVLHGIDPIAVPAVGDLKGRLRP